MKLLLAAALLVPTAVSAGQVEITIENLTGADLTAVGGIGAEVGDFTIIAAGSSGVVPIILPEDSCVPGLAFRFADGTVLTPQDYDLCAGAAQIVITQEYWDEHVTTSTEMSVEFTEEVSVEVEQTDVSVEETEISVEESSESVETEEATIQ